MDVGPGAGLVFTLIQAQAKGPPRAEGRPVTPRSPRPSAAQRDATPHVLQHCPPQLTMCLWQKGRGVFTGRPIGMAHRVGIKQSTVEGDCVTLCLTLRVPRSCWKLVLQVERPRCELGAAWRPSWSPSSGAQGRKDSSQRQSAWSPSP